MSKSERERRDAEKDARRAKRLAERAEQRAQRKGEQAEAAADRAEQLASRTNRRRPSDRHRDTSIENLVDDVAEKWSRKATEWLDDQSQKMFDESGLDGRSEASKSSSARRSSARRRAGTEDTEEFDTDSQRSTRRRPHRRKSRAIQRQLRKRSGHGLYRDTKNKKVCGVCAGSAEYLGFETWQVRMVAVFGLIFIPSLTIPAYFITWFLMDKKPYYREATERYDQSHHNEAAVKTMRKRKAKNRTKEPKTSNVQALKIAQQKFVQIEEQLRDMESHVTSSQFELKREFKKIAGDDL